MFLIPLIVLLRFGDEERDEEELAQEEVEEAAREASAVGGMVDYDV